jgi:ABC-type phosphate transport system ATPase subunit
MGEIIEQGPANEFFDNPQNQRTKEYLSGVFN